MGVIRHRKVNKKVAKTRPIKSLFSVTKLTDHDPNHVASTVSQPSAVRVAKAKAQGSKNIYVVSQEKTLVYGTNLGRK